MKENLAKQPEIIGNTEKFIEKASDKILEAGKADTALNANPVNNEELEAVFHGQKHF